MRVKSENKWRRGRGRRGREREGRVEGGGNKGDSPSGAVGGLSHARTAAGAWTGGVLGVPRSDSR